MKKAAATCLPISVAELQAGIAEGEAHCGDLQAFEVSGRHTAGGREAVRYHAGASIRPHALQAGVGFGWPVDGVFDSARAGREGDGETRATPPQGRRYVGRGARRDARGVKPSYFSRTRCS